MNKNLNSGWTPLERSIFRFSFCYLVFFFVFYSRFFVSTFPVLKYIHAPFEFMARHYVTLVNNIVFHQRWDEGFSTTTGDTSAFLIASASFIFLALIVTAIWAILDKRKSYLKLYSFLYIYSRYYLAFVLCEYGFVKFTNNQFTELHPEYFLKPLGDYDPHSLLWAFMSSSESYKIFTGLIEVTAGVLLLSRRTTSLGSLIALSSLINVLAINIAYDTLVKFFLVHLIIIALFILSPDIKRLLNFFVFKRNSTTALIPFPLENKKLNWARNILKFGIIVFGVFYMLKSQLAPSTEVSPPNLTGLYTVKAFYSNRQNIPVFNTDTSSWKKMAINKFGFVTVQFMNDSTYGYRSRIDSVNHFIDLFVWNDSSFQSKIHYTKTDINEYLFEGTFKKDSIKIIAQKIDLKNLPINKTKGKVRWVWW